VRMPSLVSRRFGWDCRCWTSIWGFLAGGCRPNTVLASAYDLKVFFTVVGKEPRDVQPADVFALVTAQRGGQPSVGVVVQPVGDDEAGGSLRTVRRRLSSVSGLLRSCMPVVRCRPTQCRGGCRPGGNDSDRTTACRSFAAYVGCRASWPRPRWTPSPVLCARIGIGRWWRRWCWAGCAAARCSGCGWRICGSPSGGCSSPRGEGGHQRLVPLSRRFFDHVAAYLASERPQR
jgi:integrase/recombinase XerD